MSVPRLQLLEILRQPQSAIALSEAEWDVLIPQARNSLLMASLAIALAEQGLLESVPSQVRRHLESEWVLHKKQKQDLAYEMRWLRQAMAETGEKLVLLKGAAYIVAALPAGAGRFISDIDLLVPIKAVQAVEQKLAQYGWTAGDIDSYNERYYRRWMHEIPPLGHSERESTLDVHHTLLPPTSDACIDTELLFDDLQPLDDGCYRLGDEDIVLHSAIHLFHEGEFDRGLRDLLDIDRLIRQFSRDNAAFWPSLLQRAELHGVQDSLYYALRYAQLFYQLPLPPEAQAFSAGPGKWRAAVMDFFFRRGFLGNHASTAPPLTGLARSFLYIRSHYLRMPLYLLLPHLLRKAWMSLWEASAADGDAEQGAHKGAL